MSLGTWTPNTEKKALDINANDINQFIPLGNENDVSTSVTTLTDEQLHLLTTLVKQERDFWQQAAETLTAENIICLIRFFTLVEEQHSQLTTGNNSPVITLNKMLKQRKTPLSKEMLQWIKTNSSNRFLPNGSVL